MSDKNYYSILGVSEDASQEEIKRAYRELAKKYHPDKTRGDKKAEERFKEINEAYGILSDPEKRKKYDQLRKMGAHHFAGQGMSWEDLIRHFDAFQEKAHARDGGGPRFGFGGFGVDIGLDDLFSSFFDEGEFFRRSRSGRQAGQDIHTEISIPFRKAVEGGPIELTVPQQGTCPTCHGSGAEPGSTVQTCPVCRGTGMVSESRGAFAITRPCVNCMGKGKVIEKPCTTCSGTGTVTVARTVKINIPAGIEDGTTLKIAGEGHRGIQGGPPGDLYVTVRVQEDRFFKRKGSNIYVELPLNLAQALLGSRVKIKTPYGNKVILKIPPGTQPGHKFRLKGQGIRTARSVGDMYVIAKVEIPKHLTEQEKELIRKFADLQGMKY